MSVKRFLTVRYTHTYIYLDDLFIRCVCLSKSVLDVIDAQHTKYNFVFKFSTCAYACSLCGIKAVLDKNITVLWILLIIN